MLRYSIIVALLLLVTESHTQKRGGESRSEEDGFEAVENLKKEDADAAKKLEENKLAPEKKVEIEAQRAKIESKVLKVDSRFPESVLTKDAVSGFYLQKGNRERAREFVDEGLKNAKPGGNKKATASLLSKRSLFKYIEGDLQGAYADCTGALSMDGGNKSAFELCKFTESGMRARDNFAMAEIVKELEKRHVGLQNRRVPKDTEEYFRMQDSAGASEAATLAAESLKARNRGDLAAAQSHAESAVKADPSDPFARIMRARVYEALKDHNGMIIDLTQAISKGWTEPVLFKLRGEALLDRGSYAAAAYDAELLVAYAPQLPAGYYIRAMARKKRLENDPAALARALPDIIADLKKVYALKPHPDLAGLIRHLEARLAQSKVAAVPTPGR